MSKLYLLFLRLFAVCFLLISSGNNVKSQNFMFHGEFLNNWAGPGYNFNNDIPGYPSVTVMATNEAEEFIIESDNYYNKWDNYGLCSLDVVTPFVFYPNTPSFDPGNSFLADSAVIGHYYTVRLKNVGYQSCPVVVMHTSAEPVVFDSANAITQLPVQGNISAGQSVALTVNVASARSPEEKVYIRYTINSFVTSAVIPVYFSSLSDLSGNAVIPGLPASTTVTYYAFTTTLDSQNVVGDYDLITLRQATNGGANYQYIVNAAPVITRNIVFMVNMGLQTVSANGVFLAGTFNNFNFSNQMTHTGNGIYVDTLALDTTSVVQYKFVNGQGPGAQWELVPINCGVNDGSGVYNRSLIVPENDYTIPSVCFNECSDCLIPPTVDVTFRVNMSQQIVSPLGVHLEGSFNGFSPVATPMTDIGSGVYEATVTLDTGIVVIYKFNNGNNYVTEEVVPGTCGVPSTFGGYDREFTVPDSNVVLPVVCFGQCVDCPVPVYVPVTFRVNMSQQTISPQGVHLAGTFNGWDLSANPLTDMGGGIYETTIQLDTTQIVQYKFVNGDTVTGYEIVPSLCGFIGGGGIINRQFTVPSVGDTLPTVCFGQCSNCIVPVYSNVVFLVNMAQQTVSAQGVYLAGSFNGFSPTANPMTHLGGGIYADTLSLDTNEVIQYKFVNGTLFENVPSSCGQIGGGGFINRSLNIPSTDTVLLTVCFGECSDCVIPVPVAITFRVNMSQQTIAGGVYLAGTFNSFNAIANPMTDIGSGIYETTVNIDTGSVVQYKFVNGTNFETVPFNCGVNDGTGIINRVLTTGQIADTLNTVCFGQCSDCIITSMNETQNSSLLVYPVPALQNLYIVNRSNTIITFTIYDSTGKEMLSGLAPSGENRMIDVSSWSKGFYYLRSINTENTKGSVIVVSE